MIRDNHLEIVPPNVSEKDVHEECLRRNARAGYTTRLGEPPYRTKIMNNGFGESKLNIWPRNPITGELLDD